MNSSTTRPPTNLVYNQVAKVNSLDKKFMSK
jgi:hypothetical protein